MLKVVVDTNVIVSALVFGGGPDKILSLANLREIELFISPFILEETQKVLKEKFQWSSRKIEEASRLLKEIATPIYPQEKVAVIKKDSDNRILEAGLASQADFIVTGDTKHLLPLKVWQRIKMASVKEFLDFLGVS